MSIEPRPPAVPTEAAPQEPAFHFDGLRCGPEPKLDDALEERETNWLHTGLGFEVG